MSNASVIVNRAARKPCLYKNKTVMVAKLTTLVS